MMDTFIQIIIPTYNASGSIEELVNKLETTLSDFSFKIILVDDASKDNTPSIIEYLAEKYDNIICHFSHVNNGQQNSLKIGLNLLENRSNYVITMDDDLQNPVEAIEQLILKIEKGYDLVYAIPIKPKLILKSGDCIIRYIGSKFRDILFNSFTNKPPGIRVSAFRIMTYDLALKIAASTKKHFYLSAEAFQYHIKVANIYYHYVPRFSGKSSYNFIKLLKIYLKLLLSYKLKLSGW